MPFDPLSIISYVGTTAGLIGFLVSTVTRLEQYGRDFRDCEVRLREYDSQVGTCMLHLRVWKEVWCGQEQPHTDEEYEYFLGTENFQEMKTKLYLIQKEISEIGLLLYSKDFNEAQRRTHIPSHHQWEHWRAMLDHARTARKRFHPDGRWLQKVCFSSFRGMNLNERIKRLKDLILDLKDFSREACWENQFRTEISKDIRHLDLLRILDRKSRFEDLTRILQELHQRCINSGTWSLVLSPPDEEGGPSSMDHAEDVLIEFDVHRTDPNHGDIGIVPFRWSKVKDVPLDEYLSLVETTPGLVIPSWRSQFLRNVLAGPEVHETKSVMTRTALGLVNWTLLLWQTPWTARICTCRIRFVDIMVAGGMRAATLTPASDNTSQANSCGGCGLEGRKALLLGLSLAELALRRTVEVTLRSGKPVFFVGNDELYNHQLLRRINKCSPGFMPAVRFCLYYDSKMVSRNSQFRAEHIILFKEEVIDLLDTYYRAIKMLE